MGWTLHSIACHILSLGIVGNDLGISLAHFIIIIARANVNKSSQDGSKHKALLANELTVKAEPVKQLYCPQPVMPYSVPVTSMARPRSADECAYMAKFDRHGCDSK